MTATTAAAGRNERPRPLDSDVACGGKTVTVTSRPAAWLLAGAMLAGFFVLAVTSVLEKSPTYDETVHLTAGLYYWKLNDYRVDPENGNLPQRWMALPLLARRLDLPSLDTAPPDQWVLAHELLYMRGNDPVWIVTAGRVMIALLAVGLGVLVYAWSSRLFGRGGGLISTGLYCFSTIILAHGRLATSDLTAALLFLASVGCLWWVLHRFRPLTVLGSAIVMGLLFVSKMSALLIVPMGVALIVIRLIQPEALVVACGRFRRRVCRRLSQLGLFLGAVLVHAVVVVLVIWAFYGFRYSAIRPGLAGREQLDARWHRAPARPFPMQGALVFVRDHRLLPEAFLFGQAHVLKHSWIRLAFLNGRYSIRGWRWFFPYCFLVKTPLSFFVILALAAAAAVTAWRKRAAGQTRAVSGTAWEGFYRTAPLWVLLGVYWATAIASRINIGHRHILPTYPVLFILAGGAVELFRYGRRSVLGWVLGVSLVAYVGEGLWTWPHYLAYFNQLVGGARNGYRHLVDSSLDWGQDLPGLKRWLDREGLSDPSCGIPVYLSYFGTSSPTFYGIRARRLPGFIDLDARRRDIPFMLTGGVYCISATMLQTVLTGPPGPWTASQEASYQAVLADVGTLLQGGREATQAALAGPQQEFWSQRIGLWDYLRFKRLCVYLRHRREPDDQVGYSILIYHLGNDELDKALLGPPVEIAPEDPSLFTQP